MAFLSSLQPQFRPADRTLGQSQVAVPVPQDDAQLCVGNKGETDQARCTHGQTHFRERWNVSMRDEKGRDWRPGPKPTIEGSHLYPNGSNGTTSGQWPCVLRGSAAANGAHSWRAILADITHNWEHSNVLLNTSRAI